MVMKAMISMVNRGVHFLQDRRGATTVEYALIMGIITVGIFVWFAPTGDTQITNFYNVLRDGYRRAVVFVSVPLL